MPPLPAPFSMIRHTTLAADVFSACEIARAAGVSPGEARALLASGAVETFDGRFVPADEAVVAVRSLLAGRGAYRETLFQPPPAAQRAPGRALAASTAVHAATLALVAAIASWGAGHAAVIADPPATTRLVFLATPGPGGGGGGGGLRQPAPPARAEMKGPSPLRSPVPPPRPLARKPQDARVPPPPPFRPPVSKPVEPPVTAARTEKTPQVIAPVASTAADTQDRAGVLTGQPAAAPSQGPGAGGGAGTGQGTGIGEGDGTGIGPGSGGGTGGGPYRPGAGITPPAIVREVKPEYTEDARRRAVEGDVVLEIIVRADGSVGAVKLLQGLGAGLDERAVDAVRQWRFSPAHRYGRPVDVVVEVAVEFKLR